jgi:hypothetical protein
MFCYAALLVKICTEKNPWCAMHVFQSPVNFFGMVVRQGLGHL